MKTILDRIIHRKTQEVHAAQQIISEIDMQGRARSRADDVRDFYGALLNPPHKDAGVIAEIKRASPSKGLLRDPFKVAEIAKSYAQHGAACLSILTDQDFFQGNLTDLEFARAVVSLPILRKDFVISTYQIYEARAFGADAVLLIVACLSDIQLQTFTMCARALNLTVLIEVHDWMECQRVLPLIQKGVLLGVNNRNLHTFETCLDTSIAIKQKLSKEVMMVSESGIASAQDIAELRSHGITSYLIGEIFMRAPDPGVALAQLFGRVFDRV